MRTFSASACLRAGDVADGGQMHVAPVPHEETPGDFDGENGSVSLAVVAQWNRDDVVANDRRAVGDALGFLGFGRQLVVFLLEQLGAAEAIERFGRTIGLQDAVGFVVDQEDCVRFGLE